MLRLYRICWNVYNPLDPTGASRTFGRWHVLNQRILYFSSSLALCVLELKANSVSFAAIRKGYHYIEAEVDADRFSIEEVPDSFYVKSWTQKRELTRDFGDEWFKNKKSPVLKVRSAVLPTDSNFILNTIHPDFASLKFSKPLRVPLDSRVY